MAHSVLPDILPDSLEKSGSEHEEIPPYKVIFLDDNVTTMEFVVEILIALFGKDFETAQRLMREVHTEGASQVALLSKEQAELKQEQVHEAARASGFPFRCLIEPA
jgi:ATP-dependent Clp protease adaptor protein ClpS